jgi:hypothetical protein
MLALKLAKMAASDVILDFVCHYLDKHLYDGEVNCVRLKDYLKVVLMELKSAQQIIKILQDEKVNSYNLKNQVNPPNLVH